MAILANKVDKRILKERLKNENIARKTISFYRYVNIPSPLTLRDELFKSWSDINCFGRVYLANEGINAQMSVPESAWENFVSHLYSLPYFKDVPFKHAVDGNGKSFYKLIVKVRDKIVSDGINDPEFDAANTGTYLNAQQFNAAIEKEDTIVIDMRNHYESEVGRFDRAFCPNADTFREELPLVIEHLKGKEDKKTMPLAVGKTFHDFLDEQLHLLDLDEHDWQIADQLIGSIDDDGYLRRELDAIVDDLAFQKNLTTTVEEIEEVSWPNLVSAGAQQIHLAGDKRILCRLIPCRVGW